MLLLIYHQHPRQQLYLVIIRSKGHCPRQEGQVLKHTFSERNWKRCLFRDAKFHTCEIRRFRHGFSIEHQSDICQPKPGLIDDDGRHSIGLRKTHLPRALSTPQMLNPAVADHIDNQRDGECQNKMFRWIIAGALLVCGSVDRRLSVEMPNPKVQPDLFGSSPRALRSLLLEAIRLFGRARPVPLRHAL